VLEPEVGCAGVEAEQDPGRFALGAVSQLVDRLAQHVNDGKSVVDGLSRRLRCLEPAQAE